jgi:F-type H+-transporting ATPase subunit b
MENLIKPDPGLIIWTLIAFGTVFLILKKYAWKPILKALDDREQSISNALHQAEKAREEMAKLKSDNEKILAAAKEERAQILKEARETSDKLINEAKERAREEAHKIVANAKVEIENQKMAALTDVKNQVGLLAIELSQKILKRELKEKQAHDAFVKDLVNEMKLN